jgi:hypothetical protein
MTIEQAIQKAIEGGLKEGKNWQFVTANRYWVAWLDGNGTSVRIRVEIYLLDPSSGKHWGRRWGGTWTIEVFGTLEAAGKWGIWMDSYIVTIPLNGTGTVLSTISQTVARQNRFLNRYKSKGA